MTVMPVADRQLKVKDLNLKISPGSEAVRDTDRTDEEARILLGDEIVLGSANGCNVLR